jgi:hypothetical protein
MIRQHWLDRAELDQRLLASKTWFRLAVVGSKIHSYGASSLGKTHVAKFEALSDSLAMAKPKSPAYERILRRLADGLGTMDAALTTPEQHEIFHPIVRVWLRAQARDGYHLTVPGVTPAP